MRYTYTLLTLALASVSIAVFADHGTDMAFKRREPTETVKYIIERSINPIHDVSAMHNALSAYEKIWLAAHAAAQHDKELLMYLILRFSIDPNTRVNGRYLIEHAYQQRNFSNISSLLQLGADIAPIWHIIYRPEHLESLSDAANHHAHGQTLQIIHIARNCIASVVIYMRSTNNLAGFTEYIDIHPYPFDIVERGQWMYEQAIHHGQEDICRELLRKAIEYNMQNAWGRIVDHVDLTQRTHNRSTLLHTAITYQRAQFMQAMRDLCFFRERVYGRSNLWSTLATKTSNISRELDNPDMTEKDTTPMTYAVQSPHGDTIAASLLDTPHDDAVLNTLDGTQEHPVTTCCQVDARNALSTIAQHARVYPKTEQAYDFLFTPGNIDESTIPLAEQLLALYPYSKTANTPNTLLQKAWNVYNTYIEEDSLDDEQAHNIRNILSLLNIVYKVLEGIALMPQEVQDIHTYLDPTTVYIISLRRAVQEVCNERNVYVCTSEDVRSLIRNGETTVTTEKKKHIRYNVELCKQLCEHNPACVRIRSLVANIVRNATTRQAAYHDMSMIWDLLHNGIR